MPKFTVHVTRSVSTQVEVEADDGRAAAQKVDRRDFELPGIERWQGGKDRSYRVDDADGVEVWDEQP
jgi:hypothetical protein